MATEIEQDVLLENLTFELQNAPEADDDSETTTGPIAFAELTGTSGNDNLDGTSEDDTLEGLAGNDRLRGFAGDDTLIGGSGDDRIIAGGGEDTLGGGGGDDLLLGQGGADIINAGGGNDDARGGGGNDTVRGHAGNDELRGGSGDDTVSGNAGNDTVYGNTGTDTLLGNAGNDRLIGGEGDDSLSGGSGTDTAVFVGTRAQYDISASDGTIEGTRNAGLNDGTDTFTGIEVLEFSNGRTLIVGAGGYQTIQAAVDAAEDGDFIQIAAGVYTEQVVIDDAANLTIIGEEGAYIRAPDTIATVGPFGEDAYVGALVAVTDSSNIRIEGVELLGRGRGDSLDGPAGELIYAGVVFADSSGVVEDLAIRGVRQAFDRGEPSNLPTGEGVIVYSSGGTYDVTVRDTDIWDFQKAGIRAIGDGLTLTAFGNSITGSGLLTRADSATQFGIIVQDGAAGAIRNNVVDEIGTLRGDSATAGIFANGAADGITITNNQLDGTSEGDSAHTGIIIDGETNRAVVENNTFTNVLNGVAALNDVDRISISGNSFVDIIAALETLEDGSRPGLYVSLSGDDNDGGVPFTATNGTDLLEGSDFGDTIFGLGGDDLLEGAAGNDVLDGGDGNDTVSGEAGNDTLIGGAGSDLLNGAPGEDTLDGGAGNDALNGGADSDRLDGGAGDDVLNGQGGVDTYVFSANDAGSDTVVNFETGEAVELFDFSFVSVETAQAAFTQVGDDVVFSAGDVIVTFENSSRDDVIENVTLGSSSETVLAEFFDFDDGIDGIA